MCRVSYVPWTALDFTGGWRWLPGFGVGPENIGGGCFAGFGLTWAFEPVYTLTRRTSSFFRFFAFNHISGFALNEATFGGTTVLGLGAFSFGETFSFGTTGGVSLLAAGTLSVLSQKKKFTRT